MQFCCGSLGKEKLGAGSRVFEEKSEVEEQVPWLRNIVISGHAGYDRQLIPSKTFHGSVWARELQQTARNAFNAREPFKRCSHLSENLF